MLRCLPIEFNLFGEFLFGETGLQISFEDAKACQSVRKSVLDLLLLGNAHIVRYNQHAPGLSPPTPTSDFRKAPPLHVVTVRVRYSSPSET
jgi:hypothetical protein